MFRKALSYGGTLLLAGAAVVMTPGFGLAQRHGGGGGGGHAGGGGHFSGGHAGGYVGGYHGGYGGGGYRGGYYGGYRGYGGYGGYYGGGLYGYSRYGYYPYYGNYGYYGYYGYYPSYDTYPDAGLSPTFDSGYDGSYQQVVPAVSQPSVVAPAAASTEADTSAHVTVNVPADAKLWFGSTAMTSTGPVRQFESPPLTPGHEYSYEVRATWSENGQEVTRTQQFDVSAGAHVNVSFLAPSRAAGQASAIK